MDEKQKRGRPRQGKVARVFTLDEELAAVLDAMQEGDRSQFVNDWLGQNDEIVSAILKSEGTMNQARLQGKRDEYAKMVGGFAVAQMSNGLYDYFPAGQPPNVDGDVDKGAQIVEKWHWNGNQWRKIA